MKERRKLLTGVGLKLDHNPNRVYVLVGDGEMDEGQIWEAAMSSGAKKLNNLCAIIDNNGLQAMGRIADRLPSEPIADMDAKVPMMLDGNFKPGFRIDLHIKDLNNALDTGHGVGTPMLLTSAVQEMMQWLHNNGSGSDDHSAILKYYEKLSGVEMRKLS